MTKIHDLSEFVGVVSRSHANWKLMVKPYEGHRRYLVAHVCTTPDVFVFRWIDSDDMWWFDLRRTQSRYRNVDLAPDVKDTRSLAMEYLRQLRDLLPHFPPEENSRLEATLPALRGAIEVFRIDVSIEDLTRQLSRIVSADVRIYL